ncbi:hypothetical protein B0H11DRAFT_1919890 [Mycena galericulata]|nr:hypothetical protein B0H11DRAFT_1919890 [Mycena galericulata]
MSRGRFPLKSRQCRDRQSTRPRVRVFLSIPSLSAGDLRSENRSQGRVESGISSSNCVGHRLVEARTRRWQIALDVGFKLAVLPRYGQAVHVALNGSGLVLVYLGRHCSSASLRVISTLVLQGLYTSHNPDSIRDYHQIVPTWRLVHWENSRCITYLMGVFLRIIPTSSLLSPTPSTSLPGFGSDDYLCGSGGDIVSRGLHKREKNWEGNGREFP